MKLAIVIALAPDRRSGRVLSNILPADKAIDQVKKAIIGNQCPDARFPILQAVKLDGKFREHRFRVLPGDVAADVEDDGPSSVNIASLIPVKIGEGEQMVIINVTTEDEAKFLRDLAGAAISASKEIPNLQTLLATQKADLASLAVVIDARNAEIESCKTEVGKRDARIAELEAQLAEATKAKKAAK